jgi:hypothetical protein
MERWGYLECRLVEKNPERCEKLGLAVAGAGRVTCQAKPKRHASSGAKHTVRAPGRNRTSDTRFRKPMLFSTELRGLNSD